MTKAILVTILAVGHLALLPATGIASAFDFSGVGGRVGLVAPEDLDNTVGFGLHFEFERVGSQWHISPEVMYWSSDLVSDTNVNLNAYYHFRPAGEATPYLGVGGGIHMYSIDIDGVDGETDPSLNLLGGFRFPAGENAYFFAEGRYIVTDLSQLDVLGGVTWRLAH